MMGEGTPGPPETPLAHAHLLGAGLGGNASSTDGKEGAEEAGKAGTLPKGRPRRGWASSWRHAAHSMLPRGKAHERVTRSEWDHIADLLHTLADWSQNAALLNLTIFGLLLGGWGTYMDGWTFWVCWLFIVTEAIVRFQEQVFEARSRRGMVRRLVIPVAPFSLHQLYFPMDHFVRTASDVAFRRCTAAVYSLYFRMPKLAVLAMLVWLQAMGTGERLDPACRDLQSCRMRLRESLIATIFSVGLLELLPNLVVLLYLLSAVPSTLSLHPLGALLRFYYEALLVDVSETGGVVLVNLHHDLIPVRGWSQLSPAERVQKIHLLSLLCSGPLVTSLTLTVGGSFGVVMVRGAFLLCLALLATELVSEACYYRRSHKDAFAGYDTEATVDKVLMASMVRIIFQPIFAGLLLALVHRNHHLSTDESASGFCNHTCQSRLRELMYMTGAIALVQVVVALGGVHFCVSLKMKTLDELNQELQGGSEEQRHAVAAFRAQAKKPSWRRLAASHSALIALAKVTAHSNTPGIQEDIASTLTEMVHDPDQGSPSEVVAANPQILEALQIVAESSADAPPAVQASVTSLIASIEEDSRAVEEEQRQEEAEAAEHGDPGGAAEHVRQAPRRPALRPELAARLRSRLAAAQAEHAAAPSSPPKEPPAEQDATVKSRGLESSVTPELEEVVVAVEEPETAAAPTPTPPEAEPEGGGSGGGDENVEAAEEEAVSDGEDAGPPVDGFRITLCDLSIPLCNLWREAFAEAITSPAYPVQVLEGHVADAGAFDAVVGPSNSFGLMDGMADDDDEDEEGPSMLGGDAAAFVGRRERQVAELFGNVTATVRRIQSRLIREYIGQQPVGSALVIPLGDRFLVHAATTRLPLPSEEPQLAPDSVYQSMYSCLAAIQVHNQRSPSAPIRSVLVPSLEVEGAGRADAAAVARQMAVAYTHFVGNVGAFDTQQPANMGVLRSLPTLRRRHLRGNSAGSQYLISWEWALRSNEEARAASAASQSQRRHGFWG